jgi:hypothetical protein
VEGEDLEPLISHYVPQYSKFSPRIPFVRVKIILVHRYSPFFDTLEAQGDLLTVFLWFELKVYTFGLEKCFSPWDFY